MRTKTLLISALLALPLAAFGELQFADKELDVDVGIEDDEVVAVFDFKNTGDAPVKIVQIKTSCGCTAAKATKTVVEPGERAHISAVMTTKGKFGKYRNSVTVHTDDPTNRKYKLHFTVDIPEIVKISSRLLMWSPPAKDKGTAGSFPKVTEVKPYDSETMRFNIVYPKPVHVVKVAGTTLGYDMVAKEREEGKPLEYERKPKEDAKALFDIEVKEVEKGRVYDIIATPKPGTVDTRCTLVVSTDLEPEGKGQFVGYLRVRDR